MVPVCVCSTAVQSEDGDGEGLVSEGAAAGGAAVLPQRAGGPEGGAVSPPEHQQDSQY